MRGLLVGAAELAGVVLFVGTLLLWAAIFERCGLELAACF